MFDPKEKMIPSPVIECTASDATVAHMRTTVGAQSPDEPSNAPPHRLAAHVDDAFCWTKGSFVCIWFKAGWVFSTDLDKMVTAVLLSVVALLLQLPTQQSVVHNYVG